MMKKPRVTASRFANFGYNSLKWAAIALSCALFLGLLVWLGPWYRAIEYIESRGGQCHWRKLALYGIAWHEGDVTDEEVDYIVTASPGAYVSLNGNPGITDEGLHKLSRLNFLLKLDLRGTSVTDKGVKRFRESHPECLAFRR